MTKSEKELDQGTPSVSSTAVRSPNTEVASAHTPTPWRLCTTGNIGATIEAFSGKNNYEGDNGFRTVASYQECGSFDSYHEQNANRDANGAFIVKAVNNHHQMVQTLEALRDSPSVPVWIQTLASGSLDRLEDNLTGASTSDPVNCAQSSFDARREEIALHIGWIRFYIERMDDTNWKDMRLRAERQLESLSAPLSISRPERSPTESAGK